MAQLPSADLPVVNPQTGRISLEWFAALRQLISEIAALSSGGVTTFEGRTGAVVSAAGDYAASEVTNAPAGAIAATTVQAAIDELDAEKQPLDADLTALAALAVTGLVARTAAATYALRTLAAGTGLSVSNGDGVAGNPSVGIAAGGVGTTQLADEGVTLAKLEHAGAYTLLLRNAGTTGDSAYTKISTLTDSGGFSSGDKLMIEESTGELRKIDYDDLPGAGGTGDFVLLDSGSVSSAATLDIVLTSHTAYKSLVLVLQSFVPASDDVDLYLRFSTDGGSSYDATGYNYAVLGLFDNGTANNLASGSANQILIAAGGAGFSVSNAAAEGGVDAEITLFGRTSTSRWSRAMWRSAFAAANGTPSTNSSYQTGQGTRETAQDTDAIRLLFEGGGNIASGDWALYGRA